MRWIAEWLASRYGIRTDAYLKGWSGGVNQHHYEPETSMHGVISYFEYWGEEE
jgi:hypothetical protein